ncbi:hypothetical protein [Williamsia herbipolensis]|uniref:hypothetical protein n=1 Tax=Williamsia herbipolensis TaxID=1603258 RepID=UPI000A8EE857|nr:hypothetical protein [Williamsia herbipolensis]
MPAVTHAYFADVSASQSVVDDRYPYQVLSIKSNDGTIEDPNFAANYKWMLGAIQSGKLTFGIVYFYWETNWQDCVRIHEQMINANGGLSPRVVSMIDVESGNGQITGDQSAALNATYNALAQYHGNTAARVIGYCNPGNGDLNTLWPNRPSTLSFIYPAYGTDDPSLPNEVAWQYTDGTITPPAGNPIGAPPFGNCDMNRSVKSLTEFAFACGIDSSTPTPPQPGGGIQPASINKFKSGFMGPVSSDVKDVRQQLTGGRDQGQYPGWPQLGGRSLTDGVAAVLQAIQNRPPG